MPDLREQLAHRLEQVWLASIQSGLPVPLLLLAIGSFAEYIDEHRKPKDNREGWRP
jgi:hypothetical protein